MSYDLYWWGPLDAYYIYAEKARREAERKQREVDISAWRAGLYVRDALLSVYHLFNPMVGKKAKTVDYPDKPYTMKMEKRREETLEDKQERISNYLLRKFPQRKQGGKDHGTDH